MAWGKNIWLNQYIYINSDSWIAVHIIKMITWLNSKTEKSQSDLDQSLV